MNVAVVKLFPDSFAFMEYPSVIQVAHYTLNALAINSVNELSAVGDIALATKVALGVIGPTLVGFLLLHLMTSVKGARQDDEYQETLAGVKSAARDLQDHILREYQISPLDAVRRLGVMGAGIYFKISEYFAERMPVDDAGPMSGK